jgi:hypothetical protein
MLKAIKNTTINCGGEKLKINHAEKTCVNKKEKDSGNWMITCVTAQIIYRT